MTYLTYDRDYNQVVIEEPVMVAMLDACKALHRCANSVARRHGYGRATSIMLGTVNTVLDTVEYGYRKRCTHVLKLQSQAVFQTLKIF